MLRRTVNCASTVAKQLLLLRKVSQQRCVNERQATVPSAPPNITDLDVYSGLVSCLSLRKDHVASVKKLLLEIFELVLNSKFASDHRLGLSSVSERHMQERCLAAVHSSYMTRFAYLHTWIVIVDAFCKNFNVISILRIDSYNHRFPIASRKPWPPFLMYLQWLTHFAVAFYLASLTIFMPTCAPG